MAINPRKRFKIPLSNDFTIWDLDEDVTINPEDFLSMGKATTFKGMKLKGKCIATICDNKIIYLDEA